MQVCTAPAHAILDISAQLHALHVKQTQPFQQLLTEYWASLQHARELQVRGAQLDKEAAELRDEVTSLYERLRLADEAKAKEWKARAEAAQSELRNMTRDLEVAIRERDLLREQAEQGAQQNRTLQEQLTDVTSHLDQARSDAALVQDALAQTSTALEQERAARMAAADEVQGALEAREAAVSEAEKLRADVKLLSRRLVELKEQEAERMNKINAMHEEMLSHAAAARRDAEAEREAAQLIRNKAGAMAAATLQAATNAMKGFVNPHHAASASVTAMVQQPSLPGSQHEGLPAEVAGSSRHAGSGSFSCIDAPGWPVTAAAFKSGFAAPAVLGRVFGRATKSSSQLPSQQGPSHNSQPTSSSNIHPSPIMPVTAPSLETAASGASYGTTTAQPEIGPMSEGVNALGQGRLPSAASDATNGAWDMVAAQPPGTEAPMLAPVGLQELMGLPPSSGVCDADLSLPKAPYRSVTAHRGGCCCLAVQPTGHLLVSGGSDRDVGLWDLTVMRSGAGPHQHLHGMSGGVNDVAFVADGTQVLAAGADKSLHLWDVQSATTRHTLTGHASAVTCCAASPLDARAAASVSEDRTLRLWDLGRGFCVHSIPCSKMPNALAMSGDGNTIATGHIDGGICLWDVRQCWRGGSQPLAETRVLNNLITSLSATMNDSLLLVAGKDGSILLWDFRMQDTVQALRAPRFVPGTQGSMGRARCHVSLSHDRRWVAAGGADGGVYVWDLNPPRSRASSGSHAVASGVGSGRLTGLGSKAATVLPVLSVLHHHKDAVVATAWAADSSALVSADKAGTVALWSLTGWGSE